MIGSLKNTSGMAYKDATCGGAGPCICSGKLEFGISGVAKIGLGEAELDHGVRCLFGDFDANGVADIALYGAGPPEQPADVMVLLFDDIGLRAMAPLPKKVGALAVYRKPEQPDALVEVETRSLFTWKSPNFEYGRL